MSMTDIRPLKDRLRQKYRDIRLDMPAQMREDADARIAERIISLTQYQACHTLLTYVSTEIEVDTLRIINNALRDGKRVAVPRCVPNTRNMEFYQILSLDELSVGAFGVLEPTPSSDRLLSDVSSSLCIVPALSYDFSGYRLGYGKGYYDRYLAKYSGDIVGICYSCCVQHSLPHGRYDRNVSLLITEKYIRRTENKGEDK